METSFVRVEKNKEKERGVTIPAGNEWRVPCQKVGIHDPRDSPRTLRNHFDPDSGILSSAGNPRWCPRIWKGIWPTGDFRRSCLSRNRLRPLWKLRSSLFGTLLPMGTLCLCLRDDHYHCRDHPDLLAFPVPGIGLRSHAIALRGRR